MTRILTAAFVLAALAAPALAAPGLYDHTVATISGKPVELASYKHHVLLIVNTASKCGLTPQYEGLEKLHDRYKAQGLRILAFPSNDFFNQEPASNGEIAQFCSSTYGVSFDLFEKVQVKAGSGQAPLYRFLTEKATNPRHSGPIRWNFDKFLIDRQGHIVDRFDPRTTPEDKRVVAALEAALAAK